jgi:hypothetical protein
MVGTFSVTTINDYAAPAKQQQTQKRFLRDLVMNGACDHERMASCQNFWRPEVNFFLDSPFIEPRDGTDFIATGLCHFYTVSAV